MAQQRKGVKGIRWTLLLGGLGLIPGLSVAALNDTGQSQCWDGHIMTACSGAVTSDSGPYPRQDVLVHPPGCGKGARGRPARRSAMAAAR